MDPFGITTNVVISSTQARTHTYRALLPFAQNLYKSVVVNLIPMYAHEFDKITMSIVVN